MHIIDVIPLARNIQKDTLSYFTIKPVSLGDIALIPLRKKQAPAIVVGVRDAADVKTDVKRASFGLRKIDGIRAAHFFLSSFIAASEKTARYFAAKTGAVIDTLTPSAILHAIAKEKLSAPDTVIKNTNNARKHIFEKYAFQAPEKERFAAYKSIIREEFAKNRSVLFLVPVIDDIAYTVSFLKRGIEEYIHIFHSELSKQKLLDVWQNAVKETHPVLIIGTRICASIPRHDIHTVIVENEQSWAYKDVRRPFIDVRTFAEYFAEALRGKYIAGATAIRAETLHRKEKKELSDFAPPTFHILSSAEQSVVDMRNTHSPLQLTAKAFTLISAPLKKAIGEVREKNQHIFLFVSRRGLFPITLCSDCGTVILCAQCEAPLVLHKEIKNDNGKTAERIFICHKCREKNIVKDRCRNCDSWRLAPLGVGTERAEEEIRRLFPAIKIFRIDKDSAPTREKTEKKIAGFLNSPGSVLVGTELALNALRKKIAVTAALSIDPLFALPSFRINERAFNILLNLREKANKRFIIQTRIPNLSVFQYALNGNIADFYKEEIQERKTFEYPPFTTLIKLTASGTKQAVNKEMTLIKKFFGEYGVAIFPAFISKARGEYIIHAVIKIKRGEWPNEKLRSLLSALPPSIAVNVDPEHLL